ADSDTAMRNRLKRWLAQGNDTFVPRAELLASHRLPSFAGTGIDSILLLALDHCRNHVIYVSSKPVSPLVRRASRKKRNRILHVSSDRFDERDIALLRSPTLSGR